MDDWSLPTRLFRANLKPIEKKSERKKVRRSWDGAGKRAKPISIILSLAAIERKKKRQRQEGEVAPGQPRARDPPSKYPGYTGSSTSSVRAYPMGLRFLWWDIAIKMPITHKKGRERGREEEEEGIEGLLDCSSINYWSTPYTKIEK